MTSSKRPFGLCMKEYEEVFFSREGYSGYRPPDKDTRIRELQILIAAGLVPPEMFREILELPVGEVVGLSDPIQEGKKMSKDTYDLKARLACRIAAQVTDKLRRGESDYYDSQLNLIFDALAEGLGGRTEDELLLLITVQGEDNK